MIYELPILIVLCPDKRFIPFLEAPLFDWDPVRKAINPMTPRPDAPRTIQASRRIAPSDKGGRSCES